MADQVFDKVVDLKYVLETYLPAYLLANAKTAYPLPEITWYDYEDAGYTHLPCGKILPENTVVSGREAGGEILDTRIFLWVTVRCTKNRYPGTFYLYEKSLRQCLFAKRNYNGNGFQAEDCVYGMEREIQSVLTKSMGLTVLASRQFNY